MNNIGQLILSFQKTGKLANEASCYLPIALTSWVAAHGGLAFRRSRVRVPLAAASLVTYTPHLHHAKWSSLGMALCSVGGNGQSIGSTISDAIVRSWLWSTATASSTLATSAALLQVVNNWPTNCGSRFSTGKLLAIEDFTFSCVVNS